MIAYSRVIEGIIKEHERIKNQIIATFSTPGVRPDPSVTQRR